MLNNKEKRIKLQNKSMANIKSTNSNKNTQERGITLVALIVTIVVLIILSTITIGSIFGSEGLIEKAELASDLTANAIKAEQEGMNRMYDEYANVMAEDGEITPPEEDTTPTIEEILAEGEYVNYVDGTGEPRKCVVLYGPWNENYTSYGIQIIPMECVETLKLGQFGLPNTTAFNANRELYNDVINQLNNATQKYLNTTYAKSVRCVGSVPDNPSYDGAGMFNINPEDNTNEYFTSYNGTFKDADENYETDYNQMQALNYINDIGENYWLASRRVYSSSSSSRFHVRYVYSSGDLQIFDLPLCLVGSDGGFNASGNSYGLRPVFTLKSGIKVIGGEGSSGSPYELGV